MKHVKAHRTGKAMMKEYKILVEKGWIGWMHWQKEWMMSEGKWKRSERKPRNW